MANIFGPAMRPTMVSAKNKNTVWTLQMVVESRAIAAIDDAIQIFFVNNDSGKKVIVRLTPDEARSVARFISNIHTITAPGVGDSVLGVWS